MIRRRVELVACSFLVASACTAGSGESLLSPDPGELADSGAASSSSGSPGHDAGAVAHDAGTDPPDALVSGDAGTTILGTCPVSGTGGFQVAGDLCFNFTPIDTGAAATGENADVPHYALRAANAAPTTMLLFLVGSGGKPSGALKSDPASNVYAAAIEGGHAVLGLAYKNDASIGSLCHQDDGCFFPTRKAIITGQSDAGSAITVAPDESVVDRLAKALRHLAAGDPSGGWSAFLTTQDPAADPATSIVWSKLLVAGHSQGGGHAAAIGKLFPVARVVQLSSTCDNVNGVAASWTDGAALPWASDPAEFFGLATPSVVAEDGTITGDQKCAYHTKNWTHLGMKKNHRNNAASTCGDQGDTHDESLRCTENYPLWQQLFQ